MPYSGPTPSTSARSPSHSPRTTSSTATIPIAHAHQFASNSAMSGGHSMGRPGHRRSYSYQATGHPPIHASSTSIGHANVNATRFTNERSLSNGAGGGAGGAWSSLGALPRRSSSTSLHSSTSTPASAHIRSASTSSKGGRKPMFHLSDLDDDDDEFSNGGTFGLKDIDRGRRRVRSRFSEDDESGEDDAAGDGRGLPPLKLKINIGEGLGGVPFPQSSPNNSPILPKTGSFASGTTAAGTGTASAIPQRPAPPLRTSSSPVILLSNGKPLRSSLKGGRSRASIFGMGGTSPLASASNSATNSATGTPSVSTLASPMDSPAITDTNGDLMPPPIFGFEAHVRAVSAPTSPGMGMGNDTDTTTTPPTVSTAAGASPEFALALAASGNNALPTLILPSDPSVSSAPTLASTLAANLNGATEAYPSPPLSPLLSPGGTPKVRFPLHARDLERVRVFRRGQSISESRGGGRTASFHGTSSLSMNSNASGEDEDEAGTDRSSDRERDGRGWNNYGYGGWGTWGGRGLWGAAASNSRGRERSQSEAQIPKVMATTTATQRLAESSGSQAYPFPSLPVPSMGMARGGSGRGSPRSESGRTSFLASSPTSQMSAQKREIELDMDSYQVPRPETLREVLASLPFPSSTSSPSSTSTSSLSSESSARAVSSSSSPPSLGVLGSSSTSAASAPGGTARTNIFFESVVLDPANSFPSSASPLSNQPLMLRGTLLARNVAFEKHVFVRFTCDAWRTVSEVRATWTGSATIAQMKNLASTAANQGEEVDLGRKDGLVEVRGTVGDVAGLPLLQLQQTGGKSSGEGGPSDWDRFAFRIELPPAVGVGREVFFVGRYLIPGSEFWDNCGGRNWRVAFRWKTEAVDVEKEMLAPKATMNANVEDVETEAATSPAISPPSISVSASSPVNSPALVVAEDAPKIAILSPAPVSSHNSTSVTSQVVKQKEMGIEIEHIEETTHVPVPVPAADDDNLPTLSSASVKEGPISSATSTLTSKDAATPELGYDPVSSFPSSVAALPRSKPAKASKERKERAPRPTGLGSLSGLGGLFWPWGNSNSPPKDGSKDKAKSGKGAKASPQSDAKKGATSALPASATVEILSAIPPISDTNTATHPVSVASLPPPPPAPADDDNGRTRIPTVSSVSSITSLASDTSGFSVSSSLSSASDSSATSVSSDSSATSSAGSVHSVSFVSTDGTECTDPGDVTETSRTECTETETETESDSTPLPREGVDTAREGFFDLPVGARGQSGASVQGPAARGSDREVNVGDNVMQSAGDGAGSAKPLDADPLYREFIEKWCFAESSSPSSASSASISASPHSAIVGMSAVSPSSTSPPMTGYGYGGYLGNGGSGYGAYDAYGALGSPGLETRTTPERLEVGGA